MIGVCCVCACVYVVYALCVRWMRDVVHINHKERKIKNATSTHAHRELGAHETFPHK